MDDEELELVEELDTQCLVVREGAMRGGSANQRWRWLETS